MHATISKPTTFVGHSLHRLAQLCIVRAHALIPHARPVYAKNRTRPPLAYLVLIAQMFHCLTLGRGRYHFREATSFNIALSSICSANSFFSFAFSPSSAFSFRAPNTSRPPLFALHL